MGCYYEIVFNAKIVFYCDLDLNAKQITGLFIQFLKDTTVIFGFLSKFLIFNFKVSLRLQEADVDHALQDKTLLSSVLEGGLPY